MLILLSNKKVTDTIKNLFVVHSFQTKAFMERLLMVQKS